MCMTLFMSVIDPLTGIHLWGGVFCSFLKDGGEGRKYHKSKSGCFFSCYLYSFISVLLWHSFKILLFIRIQAFAEQKQLIDAVLPDIRLVSWVLCSNSDSGSCLYLPFCIWPFRYSPVYLDFSGYKIVNIFPPLHHRIIYEARFANFTKNNHLKIFIIAS